MHVQGTELEKESEGRLERGTTKGNRHGTIINKKKRERRNIEKANRIKVNRRKWKR